VMLSYMRQALPSEVMPRARSAAERAILLDGDLAEAHDALGEILMTYYWDWAGAEREIKRTLELNPSDAEAHLLLSLYLQAVGQVDEGLVEARRARELDPLSFHIHRNIGRGLYLARQYDRALAELRQARDRQPSSAGRSA